MRIKLFVIQQLNGIILIRNMPENYVRIVERSRDLQVVVKPCHLIYVGIYEKKSFGIEYLQIFYIKQKILPRGILNWCVELQLSNEQIKTCFFWQIWKMWKKIQASGKILTCLDI